jgi:hypothetical protein
MAASEFDNTQIEAFRRYFHQEMSAGEAHRFEKRLLSDALFSEAYDGYTSMVANGVAVPQDLNQILAERTGKRHSVLPLWRYSAAATVLLGLTWLGYLSYDRPDRMESATLNKTNNAQKMVAAEKPLLEASADTVLNYPIVDKPLDREKTPYKDGHDGKVSLKENFITKPVVPGERLLPTGERLAGRQGISAGEGRTVLANEQFVLKDSLKPEPAIALPAPGISAKAFINSGGDVSRNMMIRGRVVDSMGVAIPGAGVVLSTHRKTVTDGGGYFQVEGATGDSLKLSMVGFEEKRLVVAASELGVIPLRSDHASLSEVVVVGYGRTARSKNKSEGRKGVSRVAAPEGGWDLYRAYLRKNGSIPGLVGNVKVTFTVLPDGSLADFSGKGEPKIVDEAILRIKNGPKWQTAVKNGVAVGEKVSVDFRSGN